MSKTRRFTWFKSGGDFDLKDEESTHPPEKFENAELLNGQDNT